MAILTEARFSFSSQALAKDAFAVVDFNGVEGLSRCYEFEVNLVSEQDDIDLTQVLRQPAVFTIHRKDGDIPFNGILAEFEQAHEVNDYVFYRAVLVPRLWWLQLTFHNQVFLDQAVPDVLRAVLQDGGLSENDFDVRLKEDYPQWEYICQYRESHFNFVSRWMEREGIYYYFEQNDDREKLILTDTQVAHTAMPEGKTLTYSPPSGLDATHLEEVVSELRCRQKMLPRSVTLRDYNYRTPSLEVSGRSPVLSDGRGEVYIYGEHFRTPEEGDSLAGIRAQELLCRERRFHGSGTIPFLRPGYVFELQEHYRDDFNQEYLTTDLVHEGNQVAYLVSGLREAGSDADLAPFYRNRFTAIPKSVQFRPERSTDKSRFYGNMNARVDGSETGKYAELDADGRYKVVLPFDLSGRKDGKASAWIRMMQPYAGADHGMHFPLHKGAEVLLSFIDGDPDRPIIAGAVPNPESPSPVTAGNETKSIIQTGGQNRIAIEDKADSEHMLLHTPKSNTWMRMGAPNDPPPSDDFFLDEDKRKFGKFDAESKPQKAEGESSGFDDGFMFNTSGSLNGIINQEYKVQVGGNSTRLVAGGEELIIIGFDNKSVLGAKTDLTAGIEFGASLTWKNEFHNGKFNASEKKMDAFEESLHATENRVEAVENRVETVENDVGVAQVKISAHDNAIRTVADQVDVVENRVTATQDAIDNTNTRITNVVTDIEDMETAISNNETAIKNAVTRIANNETEIKNNATAIRNCETDIGDHTVKMVNAGVIMLE